MSPLVTFENVEKIYRSDGVSVPALRGINVSLEARTFVSFVGPSGSGKTTLLNLIGCLDKPSAGSVTVAGVGVDTMDRKTTARFRGETIGFIFQNFNLIPVLTVYENVEYPLIMVQNVSVRERRERILDLLERVGMTDQSKKYPGQLSGGQKQRAAVARALVGNPKLVLADEPTANLDHATAYRVIELMHEMKRELGTTFVFATHDQKVVGEAEVIYTLEDGLIVNRQSKHAAPAKEALR